jgi:hypothetical protein
MRKLVMVAGAMMVNGVGLPEEIITWGVLLLLLDGMEQMK